MVLFSITTTGGKITRLETNITALVQIVCPTCKGELLPGYLNFSVFQCVFVIVYVIVVLYMFMLSVLSSNL
jgi:hypothetical protein